MSGTQTQQLRGQGRGNEGQLRQVCCWNGLCLTNNQALSTTCRLSKATGSRHPPAHFWGEIHTPFSYFKRTTVGLKKSPRRRLPAVTGFTSLKSCSGTVLTPPSPPQISERELFASRSRSECQLCTMLSSAQETLFPHPSFSLSSERCSEGSFRHAQEKNP